MDLAQISQRSVAFAFIHNHTVTTAFHISSLNLHIYDERNHRFLEGLAAAAGGHHALNREHVAQAFFESDKEWLLSIDTNSEFEPNALYRLLSVADPDKAPIVLGLYVSRPGLVEGTLSEDPPLQPMWYRTDHAAEYVAVDCIEGGPNTHIQRIRNGGMGLYLVHRSALEKFPPPPPGRGRWFGHDVWSVNRAFTELSEDMTFFHRCNLIGYDGDREDFEAKKRYIKADSGIPIHGYRGVQFIHWKMRREKLEDANFGERPTSRPHRARPGSIILADT